MRAVGYRQIWQYLAGECDLEEAIRRAIVATRRLAKRQMTWLRGELLDARIFDPFERQLGREVSDFVDPSTGWARARPYARLCGQDRMFCAEYWACLTGLPGRDQRYP